MSARTEVKCDGCGSTDVQYTGNSVDYYIQLANITSVPSYAKDPDARGGFVTDMMIYPPIRGGNKHFCGIGCLFTWLRATYPKEFQPDAAKEGDK